MAAGNSVLVRSALALLVFLSTAAAMPAAMDDELVTTTTAQPNAVLDDVVQADQAVPQDDDDGQGGGGKDAADEDMQDRMAYLILSLWGEDLQGLEAAEENSYRDPAETPLLFPRAERRKRNLVFTPLFVTKERRARLQRGQRLRQRYYWNDYRRSQRIGRDVETVQAESTPSRTRRDAAPMQEEALLVPSARRHPQDDDEDGVLSRVRREWAPRPLFASRQRAAARSYRLARSAEDVENVEDRDEDAVLSRTRREWTDVPLFAVKQIEAARVKEDYEITHPHHHRQQQQEREGYRGQDQRREELARELSEYNRNLNAYKRNYNAYNTGYYNYREFARDYRPYRDDSRNSS